MADLPKDLKETEKMVEKTMKRLQDTLLENARQQEELFFNAIVKASQEARTKLPEEVFVQNFLPYFSGQASIAKNPEVVTNWISIAGSTTSPVDIVDNGGKVIYTVPGYYDTTVIKATARFDQPSLNKAMVEYEMDKSFLPQRANNRINEEMARRVPSMLKSSEVYDQNKKAWEDIFNRYGIKTQEQTSQTDQPSISSGSDELEYD